MTDRHEEAAARARADLKRLGEQSEKLLGARHHEDVPAEDEDWAETWGKRLGRAAGYVLLVYLVWWLLDHFGVL